MTGCRFRSRCPYATAQCEQTQCVIDLGNGHKVRCHLAGEVEA